MGWAFAPFVVEVLLPLVCSASLVVPFVAQSSFSGNSTEVGRMRSCRTSMSSSATSAGESVSSRRTSAPSCAVIVMEG
jgi:hypothetical protein